MKRCPYAVRKVYWPNEVWWVRGNFREFLSRWYCTKLGRWCPFKGRPDKRCRLLYSMYGPILRSLYGGLHGAQAVRDKLRGSEAGSEGEAVLLASA